MKKLIEKELIEFLPPLTVSQICKNIRYTDTISSSVMNYRSIWQERTSEELLADSPAPLPPSEKLVEEILAKSLFKLTFE